METKVIGNLEWQVEVPDQRFDQNEGEAYATSLGQGWRLPTVKEFMTVMDYDCDNPMTKVFPSPPYKYSWFLTSTPHKPEYCRFGDSRFFNVNFVDGSVRSDWKGDKLHVRCVRTVKEESSD